MKNFLYGVFLLLMICVRVDAMAIREEIRQKEAEKAALKDYYNPFFPVGNVVSPRDFRGERFELLVKHFDILTAENAMKPMYLQGEKGVFTFETADDMVNAVLKAGLKMHGHTLAWHQQSPAWMNSEGIGRDEAVENLVTHAKTVAAHFKGRMVSWDVLNEAIVDNPSSPDNWRSALRQTPWFKAIGPEYIEIVFKAAREADPDAVLYYNDYNLDSQSKATAVYNMVKELNEKNPNVNGRPLIDGVGMQGHYRVNTNVEYVQRSLKRFASLGVEVSITELDIQAGINSELTKMQALEQGLAYARLYALFRENAKSLGRVTIWGLDDGSSWRKETSPTLFDRSLKPKKAFLGALDPAPFIAANESLFKKVVREPQTAQAKYGSPSLNAADPLWQSAQEITVNQFLMAWQGASGSARVLWDNQYLYILFTVNNAEMNKNHPAPYEQDSIEIFIDEGNHREGYYQIDDGQYRINFDNEPSFSPANIAAGFESSSVISGNSYAIAVKIPFRTIKPQAGAVIGFDLQVNGASSRGYRQSVAVWNDITGNAWQDPSLFGMLKLSE